MNRLRGTSPYWKKSASKPRFNESDFIIPVKFAYIKPSKKTRALIRKLVKDFKPALERLAKK